MDSNGDDEIEGFDVYEDDGIFYNEEDDDEDQEDDKEDD